MFDDDTMVQSDPNGDNTTDGDEEEKKDEEGTEDKPAE